MHYYEVYIGSRSVIVFLTLGEVYKWVKQLHSEIFIHQLHPLFHLKDLKTSPEITMSYILFELNDKLYICPLKVVKKETSNVS